MADFTDWECLSSSMFWTQPSTKNALLGHEAVFVGSGNLTVRWGARIFAKSCAMRLKSTRPVECVSLNAYVVFDHGPAMACMSNLSLRYRAAKDTNLRRISLGSVLSRRVTNSITSREAAMAVCVFGMTCLLARVISLLLRWWAFHSPAYQSNPSVGSVSLSLSFHPKHEQ